MKKTIIKGCVFAATFIVVLIVSSLFLNRGNTDMTAEMKLPELPLVYVNVGEQHVNMMRGFLNAMDEQYMKESVMPIESDRRLSFSVKSTGSPWNPSPLRCAAWTAAVWWKIRKSPITGRWGIR